MHRKPFKLWHSLLGVVLLLSVQKLCLDLLGSESFRGAFVLSVAAIGGAAIIAVATEAIEEVRNARHMLLLLSVIVFEFIAFYAFQYWYFIQVFPSAFQNLSLDPVSLTLQSVMIFVFNPLYLATTVTGKALMLINTLESLVLVLFVLQNIWQFRARTFTQS